MIYFWDNNLEFKIFIKVYSIVCTLSNYDWNEIMGNERVSKKLIR